jgi:dihydrofolate reductase
MTGGFVHDDIEHVVALAKSAAGDQYVGLLGGNIAQQCLDAGLLDEIVVQVAPVLLGAGVRLFDRPGGQITLQKTNVRVSGQLTDLSFRVGSDD